MAGMALVLFLGLSGPPSFAMGSDSGTSASDKYEDAVAAVKKKDYREAIRLLDDVLENDSGNADALNYMGYSHRKLGNYERALAFYKRALDANPDHKGANEYIGEAYLELKQPTMAEMHLARLKKICGTGCEEYRELQTAIDAFRKGGKLP
jgi:tetratricopeptide (TPR) repeat protein